MKKIFYYSFYPGDASAYYRSTGVLPYISHPELSITDISHKTQLTFADFTGYDAIVFQRPCEPVHLSLINLCRDMGVKVILDFDDDSLHLTQDNPMYGYYQSHKATIMECLINADEVWVSTKGIKDAFKLYNSNIHIIPNAHNDYIFPVKDKRQFNSNKLAVWRGGQSHEADMYENPDPLVKLINENTDWTFKFIGARFHYLEMRCGDNYVAQEGASTVQFYKSLYTENPAVFFYPLRNTKFNQSKSNCSWLEATYAGAAYFGNTGLHEFKDKGFAIADFYEGKFKTVDPKESNEHSWQAICDTLLLSTVNELRKERLLAI